VPPFAVPLSDDFFAPSDPPRFWLEFVSPPLDPLPITVRDLSCFVKEFCVRFGHGVLCLFLPSLDNPFKFLPSCMS